LILGIYCSIELTISPVPSDAIITACAFLGRGAPSTLQIVCPIPADGDGGGPSQLCGSFCSLNLPLGAAGTKSKNFGIGFGRTPVLVRSGEPVGWYVVYTIPPAPATGSFIGSATLYTVPA
jgi:hypothetical protein